MQKMVHKMKLRHIYFEKIRTGEKIYEIRLNDEKRRLISVGDFITFRDESNLDEKMQKRVKDLLYFDSFTEMLDNLPLKEIGFENFSKLEVENVYHHFYSFENEKKFGVVAIMLCD